MTTILRRANRALSTIVSEKRIFVQSGQSTKYVRFTPLAQVCCGAAMLATSAWLAASTSMVVLDRIAARTEVDQTVELRSSYRTRLDELAAERDQRATEARSAQSRFQVAMEQISRQQAALLESVEKRRELAIALDLMRDRLADAISQRDAMARTNETLAARMSEVSETLQQKQGTGSDLAETLDAVSMALAKAAEARDVANADRELLEKKLADLELREKVNAFRQDEMIEQLEQAVAMSFGPLEKMFRESDVDVDQLLAEVRKSYSGTGGPEEGTMTVSTRSFANDKVGDRLGDVLGNLDRLNLLRVAAGKIPYGIPVLDSFRFTSGFGYRRDPKGLGRRMHTGVDFAAPLGTAIHATADGVVESAGYERGYGRAVRIKHEHGFETLYAHQTKLLVEKGQKISRGDIIGAMGSTGRSTGVHLHYEVRHDGHPINPMVYLEAAKNVF
jgi:murein DD-endopeptidase MepM/ murein hydrolase activator NlpD